MSKPNQKIQKIEEGVLKDVLYDTRKLFGAYNCLQDQMYNISNTIGELRNLQESCLSAFNDLDKDIKSLLELMKGAINGRGKKKL